MSIDINEYFLKEAERNLVRLQEKGLCTSKDEINAFYIGLNIGLLMAPTGYLKMVDDVQLSPTGTMEIGNVYYDIRQDCYLVITDIHSIDKNSEEIMVTFIKGTIVDETPTEQGHRIKTLITDNGSDYWVSFPIDDSESIVTEMIPLPTSTLPEYLEFKGR